MCWIVLFWSMTQIWRRFSARCYLGPWAYLISICFKSRLSHNLLSVFFFSHWLALIDKLRVRTIHLHLWFKEGPQSGYVNVLGIFLDSVILFELDFLLVWDTLMHRNMEQSFFLLSNEYISVMNCILNPCFSLDYWFFNPLFFFFFLDLAHVGNVFTCLLRYLLQ